MPISLLSTLTSFIPPGGISLAAARTLLCTPASHQAAYGQGDRLLSQSLYSSRAVSNMTVLPASIISKICRRCSNFLGSSRGCVVNRKCSRIYSLGGLLTHGTSALNPFQFLSRRHITCGSQQ